MVKPASVSFDFENLSGSDIAIRLGAVNDSTYYPITQYRFATPYVALYTTGRKFGFYRSSGYVQTTITSNKTPAQLVALFNSLGWGGYFQVDSSVSGGNVFYVVSNSMVFTRMEII